MPKLLIVEQPGPHRDAIATDLLRRGHDVAVIDDAPSASAVLLIEPPDLVVIDEREAAVLNAMAADPRYPWLRLTPVLLLASVYEQTTADDRLHVRGVLVKSRFTLAELADAVERACRAA